MTCGKANQLVVRTVLVQFDTAREYSSDCWRIQILFTQGYRLILTNWLRPR